MADVWSDDPDRTTRRGDTRTSEQVTVIITETIRHGNDTFVTHGNGATIEDALKDVLSKSPYYSGDEAWREFLARDLAYSVLADGKAEFGWATYTFGV